MGIYKQMMLEGIQIDSHHYREFSRPEKLPVHIAVILDAARQFGSVIGIDTFGSDHAVYIVLGVPEGVAEKNGFVKDNRWDYEEQNNHYVRSTDDMPPLQCSRCGASLLDEIESDDLEEVRSVLMDGGCCSYCDHMTSKDD